MNAAIKTVLESSFIGSATKTLPILENVHRLINSFIYGSSITEGKST